MNQASITPPVRFIRFGLFEADLQTGELRKDGLKIKLQEQPFRVLCLLLERASEVVTREELRQQLWSTDTFVDFEHSLNTCVKKLRQTLGDSADNPRFVETLARRGYRFIAPVEQVRERLSNSNVGVDEVTTRSVPLVVPSEPQEEKNGSPGQRVRWGKGRTLVSAVTGLILAWAGWMYFHRSPALPPMKVVRFTSYPGTEKDPALSPDGKWLAFVWDGESGDNFDVYVRSVGPAGELPMTAEKPLRVTTNPAPDLSPAWSPDGRYLAFARVSERNSAVYVVPSMGGQERPLTELHFGTVIDGKLLDWSPDGKFLAVAAMSSEHDRRGIYSISLDKPDRKKLTLPSAEFGGDRSPVFSPDGRTLAFTRSDLYLLPLNHGEPKRLSAHAPRWSFNSAWTADSREIVFGSVAGGNRQLWRVAISGAKPEPLEIGANGEDPTVSRHANRMAYVERIYNTDIWRIKAPSSQKQGEPPIMLGLNSSQEDTNPQYSPDGRSIVFVSRRSGSYEIWVCDSEGRNSRPLTSFPEASVTASPRWSPDSRQIAFDSWEKNQKNIFVVSRDGGSPRCLTEQTPDAFLPSWSWDGRWIYYCSGRSGDDQIWKMPAEGGASVRVTKNGGFESLAAADGKTLFYTKLDRVNPFGSAQIWRIPVEGGKETLVFDRSIYPRFWSLTDEGIYFVPSDWSPRPTIEFFSFATRKFIQIAALEKPPARYFHPGLSISPDGRHILSALVEQDTSDIMLVENFR